MKLFILGKQNSITHWLEDAVAAFRRDGHHVAVGLTRRPWLSAALEDALIEPIAHRIASQVARFSPDLILAIGGYHTPTAILEALATLPGRAPLVGWVGDVFDDAARAAAARYDLVAYTDSGLLGRHNALGFRAQALFLAHAVDPGALAPAAAVPRRRPIMVFVGNPTAHREAVVSALSSPIALYGPAWRVVGTASHEVHAQRITKRRVFTLYASQVAALNIRNEHNVLAGLNQRNFEPCLAGAAVVTDDQADLALCFEPDAEVLPWRTTDELNARYERILKEPVWAAAIGEAGRRRVVADHTYAARLRTLRGLL